MQEFDVTDLIRLLWRRKSFILKTTLICLCLGIFAILLIPPKYTSTSTFIPQKSKENTDKSVLTAYLQGESPNIYETDEILNPELYPRMVDNISFLKKIMYMPVFEDNNGEKINLIEYLNSDEYRPFNLGRWLKKYTINLPTTIRMAKKGSANETSIVRDTTSLLKLTVGEQRAANMLKQYAILWIGEDNAMLKVTTEDPAVSARLAQNILSLLKQEILNYRFARIDEQLAFLKHQQEKVKRDLKDKQKEIAELQSKKNILSAQNIDLQKSCYLAEYQSIYNNYRLINEKLERLCIKKQDHTPVFTMLEEVYVPYQTSAPRRGIILTAFVALGLFLGLVLVITLPYIAEITRSKFLIRHFSAKDDKDEDAI